MTTPQATHSLAAAWGSHVVDVGACGHLNAAGGIGIGPRGKTCERVLAAGGLQGEADAPSTARSIFTGGAPTAEARLGG